MVLRELGRCDAGRHLAHMEFCYHSTATIQESVMKRYIRTFKLPHVQRVQI